jgi:hypothetical protein
LGGVAVVLHPEEFDHVRRVVGTGHPAADPPGLRQDVVRLSATRGNHLVAELAWERQVGKAIAMDVAHLLAAIAVLGAAEAVRHRFHAGPRRDSFLDPITSTLHFELRREQRYEDGRAQSWPSLLRCAHTSA